MTLLKATDVPKARAQALALLEQAGDQGCVHSYALLGLAYTDVAGKDRNYSEAARWFAVASNKGDDLAKIWLAELKVRGLGGSPNFHEALALLGQASNSADPEIANRAKAGLAALNRAQQRSQAQWDTIVAVLGTVLIAAFAADALSPPGAPADGRTFGDIQREDELRRFGQAQHDFMSCWGNPNGQWNGAACSK